MDGKQKQQRSKASEAPTKATRQDAYSFIKSEIARIARRELRSETEQLKKAASVFRGEIAALKRRVRDLEKELRHLKRSGPRKAEASTAGEAEPSLRFSAKGLAGHRKRLGLSAREYGALVGASSLTVYKWEKGEARPRARFLPAIATLRTMGRREAVARLQAMP